MFMPSELLKKAHQHSVHLHFTGAMRCTHMDVLVRVAVLLSAGRSHWSVWSFVADSSAELHFRFAEAETIQDAGHTEDGSCTVSCCSHILAGFKSSFP